MWLWQNPSLFLLVGHFQDCLGMAFSWPVLYLTNVFGPVTSYKILHLEGGGSHSFFFVQNWLRWCKCGTCLQNQARAYPSGSAYGLLGHPESLNHQLPYLVIEVIMLEVDTVALSVRDEGGWQRGDL